MKNKKNENVSVSVCDQASSKNDLGVHRAITALKCDNCGADIKAGDYFTYTNSVGNPVVGIRFRLCHECEPVTVIGDDCKVCMDLEDVDNTYFRGIFIPCDLWLSRDFSIMEKVFYVEIDSLYSPGKSCATAEYLADFFDLTQKESVFILRSLEEKGMVRVKKRGETINVIPAAQ